MTAAGARAAAPGQGARRENPAPPFGPALARARSRQLGAPRGGGVAPPGAGAGDALAVRRRLADGGAAALRHRRAEAELPAGGGPMQAPERSWAAASPELNGAPGLSGPAAVAQVAILVARSADRPSVELALGRGWSVCITRAPGGVEIVVHAPPARRAAAEAALPALLGAVRQRGVTVARAGVRASVLGPGGALTSPRGSATTAATLRPGGTVAKW